MVLTKDKYISLNNIRQREIPNFHQEFSMVKEVGWELQEHDLTWQFLTRSSTICNYVMIHMTWILKTLIKREIILWRNNLINYRNTWKLIISIFSGCLCWLTKYITTPNEYTYITDISWVIYIYIYIYMDICVRMYMHMYGYENVYVNVYVMTIYTILYL